MDTLMTRHISLYIEADKDLLRKASEGALRAALNEACVLYRNAVRRCGLVPAFGE